MIWRSSCHRRWPAALVALPLWGCVAGTIDAGDVRADAGNVPVSEPVCADEAAAPGAPLAAMGACGRLVYAPYAHRGAEVAADRLPDFSWAGYRGGGVAIPEVAVVAIVAPGPGDDGARIQAAIDAVTARAQDADGLRGAVLLEPGTYEVSDTLQIRGSGVVLRGAGQGTDGTVILATDRRRYTLIDARGPGGPGELPGTRQPIVTPYVGVGARAFAVADGAGLSPGDAVAVRRTPDERWIEALGLDDVGWTPASYAVAHERTVVAVDGDVVTVDIPLVDAIDERYGGGVLYRLGQDPRISQVGVEDLRLVSAYDGDTDEEHAWIAVRLEHVSDAWVRRITALHFGGNAVAVHGASRFITVEDSAMLDPISIITGGRRYPFYVDKGQGVLFQRCYARNGRHNFATGSRVTGPNVWLDCVGESNHADDGPHHRWATGLLFDNTRSWRLWVQNRRHSGTGHGWAGAQTMLWNADAELIADAPPGAMNWAVGCTGTERESPWAPEEPRGIWESFGAPVEPRSLYLQQLADRLGPAAVEAISIPAQRDGRIWEALSAWAGEGPLSDFVE